MNSFWHFIYNRADEINHSAAEHGVCVCAVDLLLGIDEKPCEKFSSALISLE